MMLKRIAQSCICLRTKSYANVLVQSLQYNRAILPLKLLAMPTYKLERRNYCKLQNPSDVAYKEDEKYCKQKLTELLKDPTFKALYDKYSLEIEYLKNMTDKVPSILTANHWLHIMDTTKRSQRRSYLQFLWKIEKKVESTKRKKEAEQKQKQEKLKDENQIYGLGKNTLFHRIRDTTIINFYNNRLMNALLYEPTIIFDLGYEEYMTPQEKLNCAKQLLLSFSANRNHHDPFNLQFCNANKSSTIMRALKKTIPCLYDLDFPLNINSESYLQMYDKKQLVYLTPHTNEIMKNYDPSLVYIIGAMVDKVNPKPLSFQKARREGIKMMKFPLGEKLEWGTGSSKNLPLNHVISILLDLRYTNDWNKAFMHVPQRKLKEARLRQLKKSLQYREWQITKLAQES